MRFLDLLDEKIDYLFKRGKNADERCYDFFIRTITFLILALIVLCYGSFVHASENYGTFFGGVQYDYFLKFDDVYNHYLEYDRQDTNFAMPDSGIGFIMSDPHTIGPFTTEESFNNIVNFVDTNYTITGNEEYKYSYTVLKRRDNWSNNGNAEFTITKFYSNSECFIVCNSTSVSNSTPSYIVTNMDNSDMYIRSFSINYISNSSNHVNFNSESTNNSYTLGQNGQGALYFCDMPLYHMFYSNDGVSGNFTYKTIDSMISGIRSGDVTIQLNPYLDILDPSEPEGESDSNNLYLDELQVGLTSNVNGQDLLSSEVLIGVSTENNWIINHIDNYDLNMIFRFNIKDTFPSSPNDPSVECQFSAPLRTFLDEPYQKSIIDIMKSCSFDSGSTYSNFYQYYTDLVNANNYHVVSSGTFKGIIPLITETMYEGLFGNYTVVPPEIPNYTIFNFNLEVICWLTSDKSLDESGNYSKSFDFLNGVSSINSAGIFKNNNPWEGEQLPSSNPLIPSGGNPISGGSGSNNVSVTVNNDGNHKIPLNVHTKKELNDTINNYGEITDTFFDTYKNLTDETKEDGYISLLRQTLPEVSENVPIIDFMLKCAICVIALGVIIFVLKVLLF